MKRVWIGTGAVALAAAALAQGPGSGRGWSIGAGDTPGWALMSAEERVEHRNRLRSVRTFGECKLYVEGHHEVMAERAREKGQTLPSTPRTTICERMKKAGRLR